MENNDFLRVLDCFLLDRLEQYLDDPEILFGIKKIKDLIPTIENLANRLSEIESEICTSEFNLPELRDEISELKWDVHDIREELKIREFNLLSFLFLWKEKK